MTLNQVLEFLGTTALATAGVALVGGVISYDRFKPVAITLGPSTTTIYFRDPTLDTRVHEAIHRRQMRDKSSLGRLASALRYTTDYGYRLDEEAEAKAGEICLQGGITLSPPTPRYSGYRGSAGRFPRPVPR